LSSNEFADVAGDSSRPSPGAVIALVQAVMAEGAALGWSGVPTEAEATAWWESLLADVSAGRAAVVAAWSGRDGSLIGLGEWRRYPRAPQAQNADLEKVFVDSATRGQGVGQELIERLVDRAQQVGIEQLTLDCRGNNHGAIRLYERLGFVEYGRLTDFVAAGADRWDKVHMVLDLRTGAEAVHRHGDQPVGEGSST
jgi:ribosomal protein S18 acetylase RimI-like enzyme